jgi:glycerol-3-phosphate dehydrogenase (NAD(P)+)
MERFGLIGAGAWGTALAITVRRAGRTVLLWDHDSTHVVEMANSRQNKRHLPGIELDHGIIPTQALDQATQADALILAPPAQYLRSVCLAMKDSIKPHTPVVIAAKGIEMGSGRLMSEIVTETLPDAIPAILTGPTFAHEVAKGLPSVITLACADSSIGRALVQAMGTATFRPYLSDDMIGAQVGGAVKNVLAIACGIVEGRGLGDNARAALVTRGLAELTRYAVAKGGRAQTLIGPAGLGDLVLTASSSQSRNYSLGFALGSGLSLNDALEKAKGVTEGVWTAGIVVETARILNLDMPVCAAVDSVINGGVALDVAIANLLNRPFRFDGG